MLLPSFEGEDLAAFMKKAREDGKMTVMDTAWDKDGKWLCRIKEALPFTDLFMPSFEEAKALSGESDPEKIADFFFDCGCGSVIIKLGKQGALLCEKRDQRIYVPIVEGVTVKDTTGAGDAFCAGFLYGISKG
jgi:sugar/nucleoside kinase (ribokinase family)